ncbi:hypothetical protein M2132_002143 [Dysgonomonas sp. PH5-45]|uniref:hypothetical protein n=1 Tax=unclassified Dysgonomonas TaxID=2630389 RepID=UPI002475D4DD|nr:MULTISPECIES: hypothetical protein [unclassified Dysgonomonas]MDH6355796.1 hypothetical protein [Dysgonomonas sp. PH5-45]MDH6388694.1 hypothetical protein [Dysgonomonas sp. PH5-37]
MIKSGFRIYCILFVLLLCSALCKGQAVGSTFQGEIVGVSPFFLHLEENLGVVTGFCKYSPDSVVVPLKGTINGEGDIMLRGTEKAFPVFSGKLQSRLVQGSFVRAKGADAHAFYAFDIRGEYSDGRYNYISLSLFNEGYILKNLTSGKKGTVTSHILDDGKMYLRCDSLNVSLYPNGDSIIINTLDTLQPSMFDGGRRVFTLEESFYSGASFIEFTEKDSDYPPESKLIELNDDYSIRLKRIPRSQYVVRKWESAHMQNKPYKPVKNIDQARKMLAKQVREIQIQEDEYIRKALEIEFKDGTKKRLDDYSWEYSFVAYYPEIKVLVLCDEAGGDEPIDLNNSMKQHVGNPSHHADSPDKQLRITGYYPGGAADGTEYFIEKWNKRTKKYEFVDYLRDKKNNEFYFSYTDRWFWATNGKVLFANNSWDEGEYYEMEIITTNK